MISQLIVTRRGIVDINDVTINDEVYTAKRRWRKVVAINVSVTNKFCKSDHSFLTPIGKNQAPVIIHKNIVPYYVPRDKNVDRMDLDYWFTLGKNVGNLKDLLNVNSFFIPVNVFLMDRVKCKAFLLGFFSNEINLKEVNKRARLALSFMVKKLQKGYEYRSTSTATKKDFTKKGRYYTIKTLDVEEDNSYCINGLYVFNK